MSRAKYFLQCLRRADGMRTQPVFATQQEFADVLKKENIVSRDDYVIVIGHCIDGKQESFDFSNFPAITVARFLEFVNDESEFNPTVIDAEHEHALADAVDAEVQS